MMRKVLLGLAAAALVSAASLTPGPAKAVTLGPTFGLKPAADALNPIDKVRYCEFYDPEIGDYVVFWVPGPCLRYGMPGFDIWLGRYYRGHRHWRGRLSSRPWTHRGATVYRGGRGDGAVHRGGRGGTDSGRSVYRGGTYGGGAHRPGISPRTGNGSGQFNRSGGGNRTMGGGGGGGRTYGAGGGGGRTMGSGGGGGRSYGGGGGGGRPSAGGGGRSGGGGGRGGGTNAPDSRR